MYTCLSFKCLAFTWVIWPLEKSNTSSLNSFRITILFWQRLSLVLLAPTMSLIKVGQCFGHSCFSIWKAKHPYVRYIRKAKHFITRLKTLWTLAYLDKNHIQFPNIHFLFLKKKEKRKSGYAKYSPPSSPSEKHSLTSTHVGSDEVLIIRPTTYFLIPAEKLGIYFQLCQVTWMY